MSDFEAFYRGNLRLVYGLALARTNNAAEAEDLTQDTFLRAWQHFPLLSGSKPPQQRAWLVRTLRNLATDLWRRGQSSATAPPDRTDASEGIAEHVELRLDLSRALAQLDEKDRELMMLRYLEDLNSREIGEALGIPEGSVRRRLARCRKVLARHMSGWAPEGELE